MMSATLFCLPLLLAILRVGHGGTPSYLLSRHSDPILVRRSPPTAATSRPGWMIRRSNHVRPSTVFFSAAKTESPNAVALTCRGGAVVLAGEEMITFGQHLAGTFFSLVSMMFGLACGFAPKKSARLFYGFNDKDKTTGRILIRFIGSLACGIGLTAAFGIASEVEALGHLPTVPEIRQALGIGVLPRIFFLSQCLFMDPPSKLRSTKMGLSVALIESLLLAFSLSTGKLLPDLFITCDLAAVSFLSLLSFFKPATVFKEDQTPSAHESMFTRLAAAYKLTQAVLWASLWNPKINPLPSVALASLAWVAALIHITFIGGDVKECGASVVAHMAMMVSGLVVAAGGLHLLG